MHDTTGTVLSALPALRHLDCSYNLLSRLEPAKSGGPGRGLPRQLETCDVSHNRLQRMSGLQNCLQLRSLSLRHNAIKLVSGLEALQLLEHLDLGHNAIATAIAIRSLSFNRALKALVLEGNPLAKPARYRPTIICLLPHLLTLDRKPLPGGGGLRGNSRGSPLKPPSRAPSAQEARAQRDKDERRVCAAVCCVSASQFVVSAVMSCS
jgi:hypothetical protein